MASTQFNLRPVRRHESAAVWKFGCSIGAAAWLIDTRSTELLYRHQRNYTQLFHSTTRRSMTHTGTLIIQRYALLPHFGTPLAPTTVTQARVETVTVRCCRLRKNAGQHSRRVVLVHFIITKVWF